VVFHRDSNPVIVHEGSVLRLGSPDGMPGSG
jgi:hypothetical protein